METSTITEDLEPQLEIIYDICNGRHVANVGSAECPERISNIVNLLNNDPFLSKYVVKYEEALNSSRAEWAAAAFNCTACTFLLQNGLCEMCNSPQTHRWNYVGDVEGDTTYQTEYTEEIVSRASAIIRQSVNKLFSMRKKKLIFCLTRPPGHHACDNKRVGFCHKNFAIEALDHIAAAGKSGVILDIDAHHGDGTEAEILKRNYGYYISIHGYGRNVYPGTGNESNSKCLNLPLDANASDRDWFRAYDDAETKIRELNPDVIILSCGFDGYYKDSIAPLQLSQQFYRDFGRRLASLEKPILCILEGGYYLEDLGLICANFLHGTCGSDS